MFHGKRRRKRTTIVVKCLHIHQSMRSKQKRAFYLHNRRVLSLCAPPEPPCVREMWAADDRIRARSLALLSLSQSTRACALLCQRRKAESSPSRVQVKEGSGSEGCSVIGQIESESVDNILLRESGLTSVGSFSTRESEHGTGTGSPVDKRQSCSIQRATSNCMLVVLP
jgi:hypothetical protein